MESLQKKISSELQKKFWNYNKSYYLLSFTKYLYYLGIINLGLDIYGGIIELKKESLLFVFIDFSLLFFIWFANFLIKSGRINSGLVFFFTVFSCLIFLVNTIGGTETGHHLYLLVLSYLIIFFTYNTDRKKTLYVIFFNFLVILFLDYFNFSLTSTKEEIGEKNVNLFFLETILISSICLILTLVILLRVYIKLINLFDESNQNLKKILESSDSNTFIVDKNLEVKLKTSLKNEESENLTEQEKNFIQINLDSIKSGNVFTREFILKQGKSFKSYLLPMQFELNKNLFLYIKEDITVLKEKLEVIHKSKNFLIESTSKKILFLSNFSHEIRTPLNSISGLSEILIENIATTEKQKLLELKKTAIYLAEFINEILFLSKLESKKFNLSENNFEMYNFIKLIKKKFDNSNFSSKYDLESGNLDSRIIFGDENSILILITNLIEIIFEKTNSRIQFKIDSTQDEFSDSLIFRINFDFESNLNILDEIFFVTDSYTKKEEITINSIRLEILKNLIPYFNIRFFFKDLPNSKELNLNFEFQKDESKLVKKELTSKLKIIIIDDYLVNRIVLEEILNKLGFSSKSYLNVKTFLKEIDNLEFDCILIDLLMPEIDGFEAANLIRNKFTKKNLVPILAISAMNQFDVEKKLLDSGIIDFIPKPFQIDEVKSKLTKHLGIQIED